MSTFTDPESLKRGQYSSSDKLSARIRLHERFSVSKVELHRWFFDRLLSLAPEEAKILEVGCGRGDLWQKNQERIPEGWQVTLSDLSGGMLADCSTFLGDELASRFVFQPFDVQTIPYPDSRFDIVIANMMLYHVPDRDKAIREIRRMLKPSGTLLAMTVGETHLQELNDIARQFAADANDPGLVNAEVGFNLQNGGAHLSSQFRKVEIEPFEDSLLVTEVQPLLDYIASMIETPQRAMSSPRGQEIAADLERRIQSEGGIPIRKEIGVFIASG